MSKEVGNKKQSSYFKRGILKLFPFLEWIKDLKNPKTLKSDIIAGLTVAFVLVPQSMAYAGLAGLPIQIGLYTAFIPNTIKLRLNGIFKYQNFN